MMEKKGSVSVLKAYKEKPYLNSNKEPFGLTLKGKSKEYINAHVGVKALLIKGKEIVTARGRTKILTQAITNRSCNYRDQKDVRL